MDAWKFGCESAIDAWKCGLDAGNERTHWQHAERRLTHGSAIKTRVAQGHAANAQTYKERAGKQFKQQAMRGQDTLRTHGNALDAWKCGSMQTRVMQGHAETALKSKRCMEARGSAIQTRLMRGHAANARKCN